MCSIPNIGNKIPNNFAHRAEPNPNVNMEIAVNTPLNFDFGNHRIMFLFGVMYPIPSAIPHMHPTPMYINQMLLAEHAIPPIANPRNSKMEDRNDAVLMCFSTNVPNVAAPIPKKNMFKQKVNLTNSDEHPMHSEIGFTNKLNE